MDLLDLRRRIESRSVPEPNTGCWLWLGAYDPNGYGAIKVDGKKIGTHIAAYRAFKPDGETINLSRGGFWIDHICMTSACVCPDHLRAVTPRVSVLENSNSIVARHARAINAKCGHPFNAVDKKGFRYCRPCRLKKAS